MSNKSKSDKTMEDYREKGRKMKSSARVIAIVLVVVMVVFTVVASVAFLF